VGKEAKCVGRWQGQEGEGKAHLESDGLQFRGPFRLALPLTDLSSVESVEGRLRLLTPDGPLELELGSQAPAWAKYILNPPSLLSKLGIKPTHSVAALGFSDTGFLGEFAHAKSIAQAEPYDVILLNVRRGSDLREVRNLKPALAAKGMLWIVYPKGQKDPSQNGVFVAARGAGLVDVKVCRFSETHTALKFTRPKI
jgi:hypothetical protein